ncbi:MAG TPA: four helix bundle protein [Pyrinomonadaceae bacterium]|nr:four helix bundle protein [Pyrinomonadaceae bacterium]
METIVKCTVHNAQCRIEMIENPLKTKSYAFALRVVKLYKYLAFETKEFVLSKQILKSGTSIGANVVEGNRGQSKSDFVHKLSIALKEADETEYWLNLLRDGDFITAAQADSLLADCLELQKMLVASIKTAKKNMI